MTIPPNQEDYVFVYRIIAGCETKFHFECADALIDLFGKRHPEMKNMKMLLIDLRSDVYLEKNPIL